MQGRSLYLVDIETLQRGAQCNSVCSHLACCIQVFQERLSEKVHATTPKGIVGSFECPVLQRNLKELHGRPRTYVCECQRKVKKLVSTATVVRNSVLIISHITFRGCRVHIFSDNLSRNSCMHCNCGTLNAEASFQR